jgi:hypothetical protein
MPLFIPGVWGLAPKNNAEQHQQMKGNQIMIELTIDKIKDRR